MESLTSILLLVVCCCAYLVEVKSNVFVKLYNGESIGSSSYSLSLTSNADDLSKTHPDLVGSQSYCTLPTSSVSVLYTEANYTGDAMCTRVDPTATYCTPLSNLFAGNIKSARFGGISPKRTPSVAFFSGEFFSGNITDYYGPQDIMENVNEYSSFITHGGIPITIFDKLNYQGYRKCFMDECGQSLRLYGFSQVRSIKIGLCIE